MLDVRQNMKAIFAIRLLNDGERDPHGARMGQIEVGSFTERFSCYPCSIPISEFETSWRSELKGLLTDSRSAVLQYEPKFAWMVYREGEECFLREVLAMDGDFSLHSERSPQTEEEPPVSEWKTTVTAVRRFLEEAEQAMRCNRRQTL